MLKILLVDDNPGDQILFKEALAELQISHELRIASSKEECLSLVKAQIPDLILTDVILPGLSGVDLVRELLKNNATKKIPLIFLTGVVDGDNNLIKSQQLNIGGVCFPVMGKPVDARELKKAISLVMHKPF